MLTNMGESGYGTYLFFGIFCFAMGVFVFFFIPETKGLSLEKMDDLFGVTELAKEADKGVHVSVTRDDKGTGETNVERVSV